jgi:hypothetical protein
MRPTIRKNGVFGVDDRWPYPISQVMQRQTGSRKKTATVPGTPSIAPLEGDKPLKDHKKKADTSKSIEPTKSRAVK